MLVRQRHHIAFGTAGIGDHGLCRQMRRNRCHHRRHLPDRDGQHHQIRILHRAGRIDRNPVDHPKTQRLLQISRSASDADDFPHRSGLAQGQREGTADQADADDDEFIQLELTQR